MTVIIYPCNKAYSAHDPLTCIGTHETFGVPELRRANYGGGIEDAMKIQKGDTTIIAFYNAEYKLPSKLYKRKMMERLRRKLDERKALG